MDKNLYHYSSAILLFSVLAVYILILVFTWYFKFSSYIMFMLLVLIQVIICIICGTLIKHLYLQVNTDSLTGLWNKKYYSKLPELDINAKITLILIDIDNFKKINDTYGHNLGDQVLKQIANILICNIKSKDIIARWGGEEFIIILTNTDINEAYIIGDRIRKVVSNNSFSYEKIKCNITVSIGLATKKEGVYITKEQLFNFADKALYKAKEKKNQIVVCDEVG